MHPLRVGIFRTLLAYSPYTHFPINFTCMAKTRRTSALAGRASEANAEVHNTERPRKKVKLDEVSQTEGGSYAAEHTPKQAWKKDKEVDRSSFLPRVSSPWKIGAHVSSAGGVENAVSNAAAIGATSFALFLKSQRKWTSPALTEDSVRLFKERMEEFGYESRHVLPHGSYLINLGNPDPEKRAKSYECFLDDLRRCESLGLSLYNFHPGSTVGQATKEESYAFIAESLNKAHKETSSVITVLENMAGAGNIIGSTFEDLASIIKLVENKSRVAVCVDTCHAHSAGYDIKTKAGWDSTLLKFDESIGLVYLRGMHLNDSKTEYNSKRDRHENIGLGSLGIEAFQHIVNDPRVQDIPLILETPSFEKPVEVWGKEIQVLQMVSGKANVQEEKDDDVQTDALVEQVKQAVKSADSSSKTTKAKPRAKKRKKGEEDDDDGDHDH